MCPSAYLDLQCRFPVAPCAVHPITRLKSAPGNDWPQINQHWNHFDSKIDHKIAEIVGNGRTCFPGSSTAPHFGLLKSTLPDRIISGMQPAAKVNVIEYCAKTAELFAEGVYDEDLLIGGGPAFKNKLQCEFMQLWELLMHTAAPVPDFIAQSNTISLRDCIEGMQRLLNGMRGLVVMDEEVCKDVITFDGLLLCKWYEINKNHKCNLA
jgi:hypothetical protein